MNSDFPLSVKIKAYERQNGLCDCCKLTLNPPNDRIVGGAPAHYHHRKMRCNDGTASLKNVVVLCPTCHAMIHQIMNEHKNECYDDIKQRYVRMACFKQIKHY